MSMRYNFQSGDLGGIIEPGYDTPEARQLFASLEELIELDDGDTLLDGRNRIVKVPVSLNGKRRWWVIKKFSNRGLYKKAAYLLRSSKAKRSYQRAAALVENGFGTPKPIGFVEKRKGIFLEETYYITEFFNYDFDVRSYFRQMKPFVSQVPARRFYRRLGRFARELHSRGFYHADFTDGNILTSIHDNECFFSVVDLNRMAVKKRVGIISRIRGIVKLNFPVEYRRLLLEGYFGTEYRKVHFLLYRILRFVHVVFRDAKKPWKKLRDAIKNS